MRADPYIERKALIIMVAVGLAEIAAIAAVMRGSRPGFLHRILLTGAPSGWLAAGLTALAFIAVTSRRLPLIGLSLLEVRPIKLAGVVFGSLAAVGEELWFRKIPMDWLSRAHHGPVSQVVAAAILFGLAHAIWGLFARQWRSALTAMIATAALGGALALVYLAGGRSVAPCIWSHAAINLVLEPWLLLAVLSRKSNTPRTVHPTEQGSAA